MAKKARRLKDLSEFTDVMPLAIEVLSRFNKRKVVGRPPRLGRPHIMALITILKTLVDDIAECTEHLLPDTNQVKFLLYAIDTMVSVKKRYMKRIKGAREGWVEPTDHIDPDGDVTYDDD